jgi:hypothetical protein
MAMRDERKLELLKPSSADKAYLAYWKEKTRLQQLPLAQRTLEKRMSRYQLRLTDAEVNKELQTLKERRASLKAAVAKFEKSHKAERQERVPITERRGRALEFFRQAFQVQTVADQMVLGTSGACQMVIGRVTAPDRMYYFQDVRKNDSGSSITFSTQQESDTRFRVYGSVDADDRFGFDYVEYAYALAVHQFDIPPQSCDALINYWWRHWSQVMATTLTAYYGWIRATPLWVVSADGSTPSLAQFIDNVRYQYSRSVTVDDGFSIIDSYVPTEYEESGSYMVKAGVTSRIFFGSPTSPTILRASSTWPGRRACSPSAISAQRSARSWERATIATSCGRSGASATPISRAYRTALSSYRGTTRGRPSSCRQS